MAEGKIRTPPLRAALAAVEFLFLGSRARAFASRQTDCIGHRRRSTGKILPAAPGQ
jgi:hypothetical protein